MHIWQKWKSVSAYRRYRQNNITDGRTDTRTDERHKNMTPLVPSNGSGGIKMVHLGADGLAVTLRTHWRYRKWARGTRHNYAMQTNRCHSRSGVRKVETLYWLRCPCTPCTSSPHVDGCSPPTRSPNQTSFPLHYLQRMHNYVDCTSEPN